MNNDTLFYDIVNSQCSLEGISPKSQTLKRCCACFNETGISLNCALHFSLKPSLLEKVHPPHFAQKNHFFPHSFAETDFLYFLHFALRCRERDIPQNVPLPKIGPKRRITAKNLCLSLTALACFASWLDNPREVRQKHTVRQRSVINLQHTSKSI